MLGLPLFTSDMITTGDRHAWLSMARNWALGSVLKTLTRTEEASATPKLHVHLISLSLSWVIWLCYEVINLANVKLNTS